MQRLFSTFPSAWPGLGLVLLRVVAGLPLPVGGHAGLWALPQSLALPIASIGFAVGVLLVVGLWTPIAGVLQAILEFWSALAGDSVDGVHAVRGIVGLSLAMLGPGAWSVDARLFGRKRIDVNVRRD